ncbi:hypothetical protein V1477_008762 [Vespula maculifrons]|uniref:Uncharacterized protein n=1 Tax=Vespula maculifrons TaxID=7453 RepID=A0ABD2CDX7_VESMC
MEGEERRRIPSIQSSVRVSWIWRIRLVCSLPRSPRPTTEFSFCRLGTTKGKRDGTNDYLAARWMLCAGMRKKGGGRSERRRRRAETRRGGGREEEGGIEGGGEGKGEDALMLFQYRISMCMSSFFKLALSPLRIN